jgi:hypothetical protein
MDEEVKEAVEWLKSGECNVGPRSEKAIAIVLDALEQATRDIDLVQALEAATESGMLTAEHFFALREAHAIGEKHNYFDARPQHDTPMHRSMFEAGFYRGFNAMDKLVATGGR